MYLVVSLLMYLVWWHLNFNPDLQDYLV